MLVEVNKGKMSPALNIEILTDTENSEVANWSYSHSCGNYSYNYTNGRKAKYIVYSSQMYQYQQTGFHYGWVYIIDVENNKCYRSINNYNNQVGGRFEEVVLTSYFSLTDTGFTVLREANYVGTSTSNYYNWYMSVGVFY